MDLPYTASLAAGFLELQAFINIIVRTLSNTDCYLTPLHPMPNRNVIPSPIPIAHSAMREDLSSAIQYASIFDWIHQT